jgi:hypothetical protein
MSHCLKIEGLGSRINQFAAEGYCLFGTYRSSAIKLDLAPRTGSRQTEVLKRGASDPATDIWIDDQFKYSYA